MEVFATLSRSPPPDKNWEMDLPVCHNRVANYRVEAYIPNQDYTAVAIIIIDEIFYHDSPLSNFIGIKAENLSQIFHYHSAMGWWRGLPEAYSTHAYHN